MDNASAPMPVKPPTTPMIGATAQLTAQLPIDGLRLKPRAAAEPKVDASDNDVALVAAIRRGDAGSREALYHRFKRRVYALAVRIVGSVDAEEVAQEAFIRIFRGLTKFRGDARWRPGSIAWRSTPRCRTAAAARPPRRRKPTTRWKRRSAPSRSAATPSCGRASNGRWPASPSDTGP